MFRPQNQIQEAMGRISVNADAAHAFGANRHGKMIGSIADFTSFSFHAVKNLTTAEGGALAWKSIQGIDDEEIYKKLQLLSLHGQSKDALAKTQLGAWEYDVVGPWYKCNMTDIMAGIGLAQMKRYPGMLERRRKIIEKYDAAFKPLGVETAYKNLGFDIKDYPNAYERYVNEITLPLHTRLTDGDVEYVVEKYIKVVKEYTKND